MLDAVPSNFFMFDAFWPCDIFSDRILVVLEIIAY